jgi:hypothetical protein
VDSPLVRDGARELQGDRRQPGVANGPDVVRAGEPRLVAELAQEGVDTAGAKTSAYTLRL